MPHCLELLNEGLQCTRPTCFNVVDMRDCKPWHSYRLDVRPMKHAICQHNFCSSSPGAMNTKRPYSFMGARHVSC